MKKVLLIIGAGLLLCLIGIVLYFAHQFSDLFPNTLKYRRIVVHYSATHPNREQLRIAEEKLQSSVVSNPKKEYDFYICQTPSNYRFFTPGSEGTFAVTYSRVSKTFVAPLNATGDSISLTDSNAYKRSLSDLLASQITSIDLDHDSRTEGAARWKKNGYAKFIGTGPLRSTEPELRSFLANIAPLSKQSVMDQMLVTYLIDSSGLTPMLALTRPIDRDSLIKVMNIDSSLRVSFGESSVEHF